eukprot:CAMPEP_0174264242 /NCGR_PEP_ID=MMETSP0439-20130205/21817_1 /TAXON_ID=0 /ORGANISM="Stereomyxa ramosa, Strain Chinc5" /LENGTH=276 /DNA_ID=CAMNT_0015350029 /DNA_START=481 /DNA_END=1312 /DNA_ORIENTATION=+
MDIGECRKLHSLPLRQDYEESLKKGEDHGFELELELHLETFIQECDRKIERAQKRLEETEKEKEEANVMSAQIKELYAQAEDLGNQGKVEESLELIKKAEKMKTQEVVNPVVVVSTNIAGQEITLIPSSQQQKLRVCDVCGAFLSIFDSDRRLADHFGGKLHLGYFHIREKLKELKAAREEKGIASPHRALREILEEAGIGTCLGIGIGTGTADKGGSASIEIEAEVVIVTAIAGTEIGRTATEEKEGVRTTETVTGLTEGGLADTNNNKNKNKNK